jgi:O-antigen/teichoic acid export membrane protein
VSARAALPAAACPGKAVPRSRTARTLGAQTVAFALLALQQVAFVPAFLRAWGVDAYGEWLVLFFAANLVRVADGGLGYLLANHARAEAARGRWGAYRATLRVAAGAYGLHFLLLCPLLLLLAHAVGLRELLNGRVLPPPVFHGSFAVLLVGALLSLWRDFLFMLYPAHGELDRGVALFNVQLLARAIVVGALLTTGAGPLTVSAGWALVDVGAGLALLFVDLRRRHGWGRLLPGHADWGELGGRLRRWPAYAASHVADQLLLHAPVLILGLLALPHLEVVIFNTARTYTNLARQFLTQYGRAFGIEAAQLAVTDTEAAARHLLGGVRFLGLVAGLLVGCLVGGAPLVYELWVSSAEVYRAGVVLAMALPFLLVGPAQVCLAFLRHSERQGFVASILVAQALLSLVLGCLGASIQGALGMAITLSTLELIFVAGLVMHCTIFQPTLPPGRLWQVAAVAALPIVPCVVLVAWLSNVLRHFMV